jgi:O-succinylbenzoate synthase
MEFRLEHRRYQLPFRSTVRTAHGPWELRQGLYVRLEAADGSVGFGEASPVPGFGDETVEADEAQCLALGGKLDAASLSRVPRALGALRRALASAMNPLPLPLHKSLAVAALLPAGRAALLSAPEKVEAGFRVFKWKVAVEAADDELAMLDDLIALLPHGSSIRLDANGGWNLRTAERWLDRASGRPVEFIEQPLARDMKGAEDALMGLSGDYPVALALDESLVGDADVSRWIDLGWKGFFVAKPALLGDAAQTLGRLSAAGARVVFSSALETGLGARVSLGIAFAWPGNRCALGFGVWPLFVDARYDGPAAAPFLRFDDVKRLDPSTLWNATI